VTLAAFTQQPAEEAPTALSLSLSLSLSLAEVQKALSVLPSASQPQMSGDDYLMALTAA